MTPTYDTKLVAVSALALACFSVGFSVTAALYLGGNAATHATSSSASGTDHAVATTTTHARSRGCRLGS